MALPAQPVTGLGPDGDSTVIALWRADFVEDETANNDRSLRIPINEEWHILNVFVEYVSSAVAGNRQLVLEIQDPAGDAVAQIVPDIVQAASLTRIYEFAPGLSDLDAFRDTNYLTTPIPPTWIFGPRSLIRVYDNNAVSNADAMQIHISIAKRRIA